MPRLRMLRSRSHLYFYGNQQFLTPSVITFYKPNIRGRRVTACSSDGPKRRFKRKERVKFWVEFKFTWMRSAQVKRGLRSKWVAHGWVSVEGIRVTDDGPLKKKKEAEVRPVAAFARTGPLPLPRKTAESKSKSSNLSCWKEGVLYLREEAIQHGKHGIWSSHGKTNKGLQRKESSFQLFWNWVPLPPPLLLLLLPRKMA